MTESKSPLFRLPDTGENHYYPELYKGVYL